MVPNSVSLNSLDFSLVGPGNVGSSLAHWLVSNGAHLDQVVSRRSDSARYLAESLGGHSTSIQELRSADDDLLLVAVSDPALPEVALTLAALDQAPVVLHTSGRTTCEILAPLRERGSAIGSLHPLKAFPRVLVDGNEASGTVFGIDGDELAQSMARRITAGLSGIATVIPPGAKSQYHLAATLAAGGVVTLLASAAELARGVGLDREVVNGYLALARGAIEQAIASETIATAITGPLARGDLEGFQRQIDETRAWDPGLADLLEILAKRTLHHCRSTDAGDPELGRS